MKKKSRWPAEKLQALRDRNESRDWIMRWLNGLPPRYRNCQFRNLKANSHSHQALRDAQVYATGLVHTRDNSRFPTVFDWIGRNLVVTGPVGVGKTATIVGILFHIIELLAAENYGHNCLEEGGGGDVLVKKITVDMLTLNEVELAVRSTFSGGSMDKKRLPFSSIYAHTIVGRADTEPECIEYLSNLGVLILDDIARNEPTPFTSRILDQVINTRYLNQRPTIVTCEVPLGVAIERGHLKKSVGSRLMEDAVHIHMTGADLRVDETGIRAGLAGLKQCLKLSYEVDPEPDRDLDAERMEAEEAAGRRKAEMAARDRLEDERLNDRVKELAERDRRYHEEPDPEYRTALSEMWVAEDEALEKADKDRTDDDDDDGEPRPPRRR